MSYSVAVATKYRRTQETAWAAGLFEGEGSISCTDRSHNISLEMTDHDVVERFRDAVGTGVIYGPYDKGPRRKPMYVWRAGGRAQREQVLRLLYPYFGERRRAQADAFIAHRHMRQPMHRLVLGGRCRNGHLLTEETLYVNPRRGYKHCRTCRRGTGH
jgi:hypothetical protein